ncbi:YhgE/Pip domain-containing protein [Lentzea sp. NBRC 102530]|uniref:YhgE/Pip domain-containing protein n=1 Tax=Lentzea sp. NBRC 102530 TaxID=3032201 RepID=UPI0024A2492B|nr:YhgE/Pip domain-containing protein [Lentzea sp. NBRC 102530]GLY49637.1 ABC transporter [Lentzea sp. NBRC 102530]
MSALRMAFNELRRITSGKLPKLAVLALALVPLLYASLYLYANKDPYANLNNVPAALVVKDKGAKDLNAGKDVADELLNGKKFNWKVVDDADEGVRKGEFIFALTLPEDFSEALTSAEQNRPRQGVLTLTTNDANNYLGSTIANQVVNEVRRAVTAKVSTEAADKLLLGFSTIRQETTKAADGAKKLADGNATLRDKITELDTGVQKLAPGATQLSNGLHELRTQTAQLPDATKKLADGARQVATGNETAATEAETYAKKAQDLVGGLDQFGGDLATRLRALGFTEEQVQNVMTTLGQVRKPVDDANAKVQGAAGDLRKLATGADQVADGAEQLSAKMPGLAAGVVKLDDGATAVNTGLQQVATATPQLKDGAAQLATGAADLSTGLSGGVDKIPNQDDPTRAAIAQAIGDPVAVRGLSQTKAATYGAGLAPFFLGLATWIGAFVLFLLLRPLSRRALAAGQSALRVALGGWLPGALLGIVQVLVMFTVVRFVVDIEPSNPLGTFGFLALMSLTFVAILHALNAAFGAVGKFLGLILLILQLVSAGGTFPWQTIPVPLYPLHYGLPMGYAVDGLRHLMYGGDLGSVGKDALILLAWLVGALALTSVAAYKQRVWTASKLKPELVL